MLSCPWLPIVCCSACPCLCCLHLLLCAVVAISLCVCTPNTCQNSCCHLPPRWVHGEQAAADRRYDREAANELLGLVTIPPCPHRSSHSIMSLCAVRGTAALCRATQSHGIQTVLVLIIQSHAVWSHGSVASIAMVLQHKPQQAARRHM